MKTAGSVDWKVLLDSGVVSQRLVSRWSSSKSTTRDTVDALKLINEEQTKEFRRLVRSRGTNNGRLLARKALKYRGV